MESSQGWVGNALYWTKELLLQKGRQPLKTQILQNREHFKILSQSTFHPGQHELLRPN